MTDKPHVLALMDAAETVYLATIFANGPRVRALVNLRRTDLYPLPSRTARTGDFTVYLATSRSSDKIAEITADPRVSIYYSEPKAYHGAMLCGVAEILDAPALKTALWSEDWRIYWPDGAADPDYVVVRIRPDEIKGWWGSKPFTLAAA